MDPELLNYFSNLDADVGAFLTAFSRIEDRFQEAFDRGIDAELAGLDFAGQGDLDHLSPARLSAAFAAFINVQNTMNATDRAAWTALLEVVRSWSR